jgi:hypothetical protein
MKRLSILMTVTCALFFGGCMTEQGMRDRVYAKADAGRAGPSKPVVKNITNFSSALRCMDNNLMMYGVRDLVVITEDIEDKTKKVAAGAKDMLISAVSTMSQRSHAIRMIAYGTDAGNLIGFMSQRESKNLFQLNPRFSIRGSISQFDDSIARESQGLGAVWEKLGGVGMSKNASASMLGLDLTMVSTEDLTVVPGVTSNNVVVILRSGDAKNVDIAIHKFGANYETSLTQSEGTAQALRNLVDLAMIELFGKLTRTPYWTCLGGPSDSPEVKVEIDNWYYNLFSNPAVFVTYWQNQMRLRGLYNSEPNGVADEELRYAIVAYREALGLEKNAQLNQELFTAYLNANHYVVAPKAQELLASAGRSTAQTSRQSAARQAAARQAAARQAAAARQPAAASAVARQPGAEESAPLRLNVRAANGSKNFQPGEAIVLRVAPSRDAHVYCYMQNEHQNIVRFFPNRFTTSSLVSARGVSLPQGDEFSINASLNGSRETIACFATDQDVAASLPADIGATDFAPLPVKSLADVAAAFKRLNGVGATLPLSYRKGS